MFRPEPLDIVLIVLVALLLFGANRLPESARAIGQAMREFRKALTDKEESKPAQATPKVSAKTASTTTEPAAPALVNPDKNPETQKTDSLKS